MSIRESIKEWVQRGVPVAAFSVALWCVSYTFVGADNDLRDLTRMVDEEVTPLSEQVDGENRILLAFDSVLTRVEHRAKWIDQLRDTLAAKKPRSVSVAYWRQLERVVDSISPMIARDSTRMAAAEASARTPISARYAQALQVSLGRDRRRWAAASQLSQAAIRHVGEGEALRAYRAASDEYLIASLGAHDMLEGVRLDANRRAERIKAFNRRFDAESKRALMKGRASVILFPISLYVLQGMVLLTLTGRWSPGWKELRASVRARPGAAEPPEVAES